jgi:tetratricopeptide (TPR) repeat protein
VVASRFLHARSFLLRHRFARAILLALTVLAPAAASAQFSEGVKIRGRVLYAHNMQPAENVQVELLWRGSLKERTYTESRGEFEFILLTQTEYVVRIRHEGYLTLEQTFNLDVDPTLRGSQVTLMLQADPDKQPAAATAPPLSARELAVPAEARNEFEQGYRELAERNHADRSVPHFQKAIELHRDYDEAYVQLALAYFQQRQRANALRTLSKAVEIYPRNARAFALMGKVLIDTNQVEPGVQALEEALALDETLWGAHADLGSALLYRKELDGALTHARRARALNSQVPLTHVLLATVLQERKEYAEAVKVMDEFLRQFPEGKLAEQIRKQRTEARKHVRQP